MTPPRLAEWLVRWSLPPGERPYVLGDLQEDFTTRARRVGLRAARRAYWSQALRSLPRNLIRRRAVQARIVHQEGRHPMTRVVEDLRFALRLAVRQPARTGVLLVVLALGIGANTALFAIVNTVALRPLPYPDPDRLVRIWDRHAESGLLYFSVSVPHLLEWRRETQVLSAVGAYREESFALATPAGAQAVDGAFVTADLFDVLGVRPAMGRAFTTGEDTPGATAVVVVSHGFWLRHLGGQPDAVGRAVVVGGLPRTVVGVMPPGFTIPQQDAAELFVPYALTLNPDGRAAHFLRVLGRLAPGVSLDTAVAALDAAGRRLAEADPGVEEGWTVASLPLVEAVVGDVPGTLFRLQAASLCLLLIALVNVANLMIVRTADRAQELSVRTALGASAGRLGQQVLTESAVLAAGGGLAGLAMAAVLLQAGPAWLPASMPRLTELGLDGTSVLAAATLSLLAGVAIALAPAASIARRASRAALQGASRATSARIRMRRTLVAVQVGAALVLLSGAGLLVQSSLRLARVDPGFDPPDVLTFDLRLPARYDSAASRAALFRDVEAAVGLLPGVERVGTTHRLPLTGNSSLGFRIVGDRQADEPRQVNYRSVSGGYFDAMGIPVRRGRTFTDAEAFTRGQVALVNEAAMRLHWGGTDPVGTRVLVASNPVPLEIVGVVGDSRESSLDLPAEPAMYLPYVVVPVPGVSVAVRAGVTPAALAPAVVRAVATVDAQLPVARAQALEDFVAGQLAAPRFNAGLAATFAALALVLAAVGLSGVIGYVVAARTREFGIRLALGATPRRLVRQVLTEGAVVAGAGLAAGLGLALFTGRLLSTVLFDVTPADPATLALATVSLAAVAAIAILIPARRALRVEPSIALRSDR